MSELRSKASLEVADTLVSGVPDDAMPYATEPELGETLGRYRLVEVLGRGGMGVVYGAFDPELDRPLAIKLLRGADRQHHVHVARLMREARALAALAHPNVVAVFDVGVADAGLYVAMERIDGPDLKKWLELRDRPWTEIVEVFEDAGRGLAAAHQCGIVHRDFKPSNVLIAPDGRAKVVDFGLARGSASSSAWSAPSSHSGTGEREHHVVSALDQEVTQHDHVVGTPVFMAPEQFRHARVDPAADQYSYCVALYRAVYGEYPVDPSDFFAIRTAVLSGRLRPPPRRPDTPRWLAAVITRGLSLDPDDRFESMDALLAALARGRSRRRRRSVALLGIGTIGVSGAVLAHPDQALACDAAAVWADTWNPDRARSVAAGIEAVPRAYALDVVPRVQQAVDAYAERWQDAYAQACGRSEGGDRLDHPMVCLRRAQTATASILDELAASNEAMVQRASSALNDLPDPARCIDEGDPASAADPEGLGILLGQAQQALMLGRPADALELAQVAGRRAAERDAPLLELRALAVQGRAEAGLDRFDAAKQHLEAAYWLAQRHEQPHFAVRTSIALATLAADSDGNLDEAEVWLRHAEAQLELLPADAQERGDLLDRKADLRSTAGRYEEAAALRRRAVETLIEAEGPDDPDVATVLANLGNDLRRLQRYDEALQIHERALDIRERQLGPRHPDLALSLVGLGLVASVQRDYARARTYLERALSIEEDAYGPSSPVLTAALNNLGNVQHALGDYEQALQTHQRALQILEDAHGPNHVLLASTLHNTGYALRNLGREQEALAYHRRGLDIETATYGTDHVEVAVSRVITAGALLRSGDPSEALRMTELALEVLAESLPAGHFLVGIGHSVAAQSLAALGRDDEAIVRFETALPLLSATEVDPEDRGRAELGLAQILWSDPRRRSEAIDLARRAAEDFAIADPPNAEAFEAARAWVAEHA